MFCLHSCILCIPPGIECWRGAAAATSVREKTCLSLTNIFKLARLYQLRTVQYRENARITPYAQRLSTISAASAGRVIIWIPTGLLATWTIPTGIIVSVSRQIRLLSCTIACQQKANTWPSPFCWFYLVWLLWPWYFTASLHSVQLAALVLLTAVCNWDAPIIAGFRSLMILTWLFATHITRIVLIK